MKSFFSLLTVAIVMSGLMFVGCEKENLVENNPKNEKVINFNNFDLSVKNNMLSFASIDDFDEGLAFLAADEQKDFAEWNKKADFNSMAKAYKNNKAEMPAEDDILANFLNSENCVEIQGKIFQLNFEKRIVLVFENYKDYMNGKSSKTYTFDDEVLTMEFGTEEEIAELNSKWGIDYADYWNPDERYFGGNMIPYKIAYFKYGVYNTLVAKIMNWSTLEYVRVEKVTYEYKHKKETKSETTTTGAWKSVMNDWVKIRPYYGTRRLIYYSIHAYFNADDDKNYPYDESDDWPHSDNM